MGYLCALLLGASILGSVEQANRPGWSGLILQSSVKQLPGRTDVTVRDTSFSYGIITDANSYSNFASAAFGIPRCPDPQSLVVHLAKSIDWNKHALIYVVRTAPTNSITFDSWQLSGDGAGVFKVRFSAIEPFYGNQYRAVLYRVSKANLKSIDVVVDMDGWQKLGRILLASTRN